MSNESEEAAALAKLDEEKRRLAVQAAKVSEERNILERKIAHKQAIEIEKARIAALDAKAAAAREAAESTPNPEETAKPESKPKPEPKQATFSIERRKAPTTPMTTEQAVHLIEQRLQTMEVKLDKKIEYGANVFASKLFWKMFPVLCVLMIVIGSAAFSVYLVSKENRKEFTELSAGNLKGYSDLIEKIGNWTKKLGKTQIVVQAPTMAPSKAINPEKKKSVVIANYKATGSLEVFEVKLEGGKLINRSIGVIDHGARQVSYDGDETRLLVVGDVGPEGRTEPKDFKNGLWIWTFDDGENKGGLATQDSAFMPK